MGFRDKIHLNDLPSCLIPPCFSPILSDQFEANVIEVDGVGNNTAPLGGNYHE